VGYGVQLVLYTSCAKYLWSQRKTKTRSLYLLAYITLLLGIQTIHEALRARTVQLMYIDNRNYPGGPWQYFLDTQHLAVNVIVDATLFVLTFWADILILWRCWVIYSISGRLYACLVTAFPALILLSTFGKSVYTFYSCSALSGLVIAPVGTLQSSQPGLSLYNALPIAHGTSYHAISLGINIILTILIIIRLLTFRSQILAAHPAEHGKNYVLITAIIIESAALYSLFAVLFFITYALNNPLNQIILGVASTAQQIATYLIIHRLAEGRTWGSNTLAPNAMLPITGFGAPDKATITQLSNFDTLENSSLGKEKMMASLN